jgi:hypothetical protein
MYPINARLFSCYENHTKVNCKDEQREGDKKLSQKVKKDAQGEIKLFCVLVQEKTSKFLKIVTV